MDIKVRRYMVYVVNDIISDLDFNDETFDHMADLNGLRVNTCNLYSTMTNYIESKYGARIAESHRITAMLKERLDEMYPKRCIPQ